MSMRKLNQVRYSETNNAAPPLNIDTFKAAKTVYTSDQGNLLEWLWGYFNSEMDRNKEQLSLDLGCDWTEIKALFYGKSQNSEELFNSVTAFRRRVAKKIPLVKTIVAERILQALDYCRDESAMIYISGPTGRGKTYTSQYWAAQNNHGRTKYIRIPSNCSRRTLVNTLCKNSGISYSGSVASCEMALRKVLSPRNVIIADEAGHLLSKVGSIELLRDLHDMTGCGVALIFTDVYLSEIKQGRNAAYYEQFLGRLEFPIEIEKLPRRDEVRKTLEAYLSKVTEKEVDIALQIARGRDGQLRTLYKDLQRAKSFAENQGRQVLFDDVKNFVQWRKSTGAWPEDY